MVFIFLETYTPGKFQKIANFEKIAKFWPFPDQKSQRNENCEKKNPFQMEDIPEILLLTNF
jgi:hypothetical protein